MNVLVTVALIILTFSAGRYVRCTLSRFIEFVIEPVVRHSHRQLIAFEHALTVLQLGVERFLGNCRIRSTCISSWSPSAPVFKDHPAMAGIGRLREHRCRRVFVLHRRAAVSPLRVASPDRSGIWKAPVATTGRGLSHCRNHHRTGACEV